MKSYFLQLAGTLFVFLAMSASAEIRYVDVTSANPLLPYTNRTIATTNRQVDLISDIPPVFYNHS